MAFQTNVFRDGEWVTETVDFEAALKATEAESQDDKRAKYETSPMGILSRTIIQSPVVNFILPVCLRSKDHNDIAFIGVSHSQHALLPRLHLVWRTLALSGG